MTVAHVAINSPRISTVNSDLNFKTKPAVDTYDQTTVSIRKRMSKTIS